jgi:hypothetical protein
MAAQYYRLHGGRLSPAECWRLARSWRAFAKLLTWKIVGGYPFTFSIPRPDALDVIDPADLPARFRRQLLDLAAGLEGVGLQRVFAHRSDVLERNRLGAAVVLLDPTGTVIGVAVLSEDSRRTMGEVSLTTLFTDGTAAITTTARPLYREEPHRLFRRHPGVTTARLWELHRDHLAAHEREGRFPHRFTPAELPARVLETQQRRVDFYAAAGLFVPMTEAEIERARG